MRIGKGKAPQIVFMAVVSALLGYAVFMASQAALGWHVNRDIEHITRRQSDLNVLFVKLGRRRADSVADEERLSLALKSGELAGRLNVLSVKLCETRRLAMWVGIIVGAGYFVICLGACLRAFKRRHEASFFISPAVVAGAREIIEGPFDVGEGHVKLSRQFGSDDFASLEAMQLVTKGLLETQKGEIVLDISAETQPFSQFIGVLVSFAMDCQKAGKKLRIVVDAGARKSMELVGLDSLATMEVAGEAGAEEEAGGEPG